MRACSHGPGCKLPWSVHNWSYEEEREETPCTPLTLIVWAKCCRYWPLVAGQPYGTCGICGTVPVICAEPSEEADNATEA